MPIIKVKRSSDKEQIRISVDKSLSEEINDYCLWAGDVKKDDFFAQAAEYVLKRDREWLAVMASKTTQNIIAPDKTPA